MGDFENKNDKQNHFNEIKGRITEMNNQDEFPNMTIVAGHENPREVNLACKKDRFETICRNYSVGDKVKIKFYIRSKNKNGRWFTTANVLFVEKDSEE